MPDLHDTYTVAAQENMQGGTYCSPEWLTEQLQQNPASSGSEDSNAILVMDCRSPNDFNSSHISGAIHVALPTIMLRRLKNGTLPVASVIKCNEGKEKFNSLYKTGTLILYDEDSSSTSANPSTVIGLLLKKLKEDGCRVRLLEGKNFNSKILELRFRMCPLKMALYPAVWRVGSWAPRLDQHVFSVVSSRITRGFLGGTGENMRRLFTPKCRQKGCR